MYTSERRQQFIYDRREGSAEGGSPPDDYIVITGARLKRAMEPHRFAQAPPDTVALDCATFFLRHSKAGQRLTTLWIPLAPARLQRQCRRIRPAAVADEQEILALEQSLHQ